MDTRNTYHLFIFVGFIFLLVSQAAPKTKEQLMDEALQEKVDAFVQVSLKKCEKKVQTRAQEMVDSILLREAQIKTIDTFKRPPIPNKPSKPTVKPPKDTTPVKPLFEN